MVESISSSQSIPQHQPFPSMPMTNKEIHKFMSQFVNHIVQMLHNDDAQAQKANDALKQSETEGDS